MNGWRRWIRGRHAESTGGEQPAEASNSYRFFRAWLVNPLKVAAPIPSGRALAVAITADITPDSAPIIELGAGTGSFTRLLIERGVPEDRLALVEAHPEFARMLQSQFPKARLLRMDAAELEQVDPFEGEKAGAVVSGLPILSMPHRVAYPIMAGVFHHLRPGGAFYQFTYGPRCPVARQIMQQLDLKAERRGRAWVNLPPARVYRITRRSEPGPG